MNRKTGYYSSLAVTVTTALFAFGIITNNSSLSYFVCLFLAWGYIMVACSFAAEADLSRKALAYGGIAFACVYGVLISIVYFTQLSTVANQTLSKDMLQMLSYETMGSFLFNLDLLGYGMMAVSTFFIGMTIKPANKSDKRLKILLMIHGIFAPACVLMPMLNIFNPSLEGGADIGSIMLLFWCALFIIIGILSILHFQKAKASRPANIRKL